VLNDHNVTNVVNFRGNYHPTAADSVDVQLGSSNGVYGIGVLDVPLHNGFSRPEDQFRDTKANSDFVQLGWLHQWSSQDESKLTLSHANHESFDPFICIDSEVCQGQFASTTSWVGTDIYRGFAKQMIKSERSEVEL